MSAWVGLALAGWLGHFAAAESAAGDGHTYLLAIGVNRAPDASVSTLEFADDDAVGFATLGQQLGWTVFLHTALDPDTESRHEGTGLRVRAAARSALLDSLRTIQADAAERRLKNEATHLVVTYSGHGDWAREALTLEDGPMTRAFVYEHLLRPAPVDFVHLLVDACHSRQILRARDGAPRATRMSAASQSKWLDEHSLRQFPHVGIILAETGDQNTHEWTALRRGIFSHELISGLRGGADADQDGRIRYTELAAFAAAAHRSLPDPRARPRVWVRPPAVQSRIAIAVPLAEGVSWLTGIGHQAGSLQVTDRQGTRIADVHAEPGHATRVLLPAGVDLIVQSTLGRPCSAFAPVSAAPWARSLTEPRPTTGCGPEVRDPPPKTDSSRRPSGPYTTEASRTRRPEAPRPSPVRGPLACMGALDRQRTRRGFRRRQRRPGHRPPQHLLRNRRLRPSPERPGQRPVSHRRVLGESGRRGRHRRRGLSPRPRRSLKAPAPMLCREPDSNRHALSNKGF